MDVGGQHGRWFVLLHHTPSRRGGHTPFVEPGAETSDSGAEAVQPDTSSSWEGHPGGVDASVEDENAESCGAVRSFCIPLVICPLHRTSVVVVS